MLQSSSVVFSVHDNVNSRLWFHAFLLQSVLQLHVYAVPGHDQAEVPELH